MNNNNLTYIERQMLESINSGEDTLYEDFVQLKKDFKNTKELYIEYADKTTYKGQVDDTLHFKIVNNSDTFNRLSTNFSKFKQEYINIYGSKKIEKLSKEFDKLGKEIKATSKGISEAKDFWSQFNNEQEYKNYQEYGFISSEITQKTQIQSTTIYTNNKSVFSDININPYIAVIPVIIILIVALIIIIKKRVLHVFRKKYFNKKEPNNKVYDGHKNHGTKWLNFLYGFFYVQIVFGIMSTLNTISILFSHQRNSNVNIENIAYGYYLLSILISVAGIVFRIKAEKTKFTPQGFKNLIGVFIVDSVSFIWICVTNGIIYTLRNDNMLFILLGIAFSLVLIGAIIVPNYIYFNKRKYMYDKNN